MLLVESDETGTDIVDVDLLPVKLGRTGRDVLLDVAQELGQPDLVGLEVNAAAVAKAEIDRRSPAGGLGHQRLELAPGPQDLLHLLVLCSARVAVDVLAPFQVAGRPVELAAVLENRRELSEGVFAMACLGIVGDRLVDLDRVELVRQREPLDPDREPCDRFLVLERLQRMRVDGLGAVILRQPEPHHSPKRLGAELAQQEVCLFVARCVEQAWIGFDGLGQCPAPPLAVVLCLGEVVRNAVIDGRPVGLHGRRRLLAVPGLGRGLIIIGQALEGRQALQPPRLASRPMREQGPGEREQVAARPRAIGVRPRTIQSLNQKLQGPDPIALQHADVPSAPSMWSTMELAGDDETVMLRIVQVGLGGRLDQPPVALVDFDDRLAERVDLVRAPKIHQARDRLLQVSANERGIVLRIKGEGPVPIVGVLVIPLLGQLIALLP